MSRILGFIVVLSFFVSALALANNLKRQEYLNRVVTLKSNNDAVLEFMYHSTKGKNVYFIGHLVDEENKYGELAWLRISEGRAGKLNTLVAFEKNYKAIYFIAASFPKWVKKNSKSLSIKTYKKTEAYLPDPVDYNTKLDSFFKLDGLDEAEKLYEHLSFTNEVFAKKKSDRIYESVKISGTMDFDPCDGCEHSDQVFIGNPKRFQSVNVVNLMADNYYYADCPGDIHKWIEAFIDEEVIFTYEGRINARVEDYWDFGDFWQGKEGEIYLGRTTKIELFSFLDGLQGRFSKLKDKKVKSFELEYGLRIDHYKSKEELSFWFEGSRVKVYLKTGKIEELK